MRLAVNWPLRWYPSHVTTKRLIDEGVVGDVIEVHFYDGNRGPLYHRADKVVVSDEEVRRQKPTSWWYSKAGGGGSLLDYLGYGATLGTWFMNGEAPIEVTSVVDQPQGLEVDEHSITICRYGPAYRNSRHAGEPSPIPGQRSRSPNAVSSSSVRRARSQVTTTTRMSACRPGAPRQSAGSRRRIEGAVPQAGRIRAPLQGAGPAVRRPARSRALPHRLSASSTPPRSPPRERRTLALLP